MQILTQLTTQLLRLWSGAERISGKRGDVRLRGIHILFIDLGERRADRTQSTHDGHCSNNRIPSCPEVPIAQVLHSHRPMDPNVMLLGRRQWIKIAHFG